MASTSSIESFDELIIKAISVTCKSQKHPDETPIYDFIKIFFENFDISGCLFQERMKFFEENCLIYIRPAKSGIPIIFLKKNQKFQCLQSMKALY